MKRPKAIPGVFRIIKVGGLYRDMVRGVPVIAEDHEIREGRRTGRILVCAADGKQRFPRRWYCEAADLADAQEGLLCAIVADDGMSL